MRGLLLLLLLPLLAPAQAAEPSSVTIHYFRADGCPHCEDAGAFFARLAAEEPRVVVRDYEVSRDAANFYELLCTAGFPMVYTRIPTLGEPSAAVRYLYLALYNLVYVLPLAAIVAVFARALGARKLGEREGRLLKLLSGTMMLELGALLLVAPEWVGRLGVAFALLAVAVAVTWLAARLTR